MNRLAIYYEVGTATTKNIREAMKWYEKAGIGGNEYGYYNLALVYHYAKGGITKDLTKARMYYQKAKEMGHPNAAKALASL